MTSRAFGDFQTPEALVSLVVKRLESEGVGWSRTLEPTVGRGHFLAGLLNSASPPREVFGFEIQREHLEAARALDAPPGTAIQLFEANLFDVNLASDLHWQSQGPLLVIGNPPWVTNAELGSLGSDNLPKKANVKGERGLDARTGRANFDIAEAIWLKLIDELADQRPTIAMLCKTGVARNVLEHAQRRGLAISQAYLALVDARRWFKASADACLFVLKIDPSVPFCRSIPIFDSIASPEPGSSMAFANGRLIVDAKAYASYAEFDGLSTLQWRQGIKHDAASLMELFVSDAGLTNKAGSVVEIEPERTFPLLKGADLAASPVVQTRRALIVTQAKVGRPTSSLQADAPRLWSYLQANAEAFRNRKSTIYRGAPEFAMFGVGPYSFAPFKVAVSGLSKRPCFHAIGPLSGRPVLFDDTCYFLSTTRAESASLLAALLNSDESLGLIKALMVSSSKRPITKTLLQRIDLQAILGRHDRSFWLNRAQVVFARLQPDRAANWPERLESIVDPEIPDEPFADPFCRAQESSL